MSVKIWIELIRSFKIQKIGLQVQVCCREFLILQTAALCLATVRNEELLRPDGHQSRLNALSEENEWCDGKSTCCYVFGLSMNLFCVMHILTAFCSPFGSFKV